MNLQSVNKGLKKLFFLPPLLTLLISIPAYGLVIYSLAGENVDPALRYSSYFLSAYAFVITITGIAGICLIVLGMAVFMIIRSTGQLKYMEWEKGIDI